MNSSVRSKPSIFIVSSQIIHQNEASGVSFLVGITKVDQGQYLRKKVKAGQISIFSERIQSRV